MKQEVGKKDREKVAMIERIKKVDQSKRKSFVTKKIGCKIEQAAQLTVELSKLIRSACVFEWCERYGT